jgi:hypothetical protein
MKPRMDNPAMSMPWRAGAALGGRPIGSEER